MLAAGLFAFRVRGRPGFALTLLGAAFMVAALEVWFAWAAPANAALKGMPISAPPPDWMRWSDQWNYTHICLACPYRL